MVYSNLIKCKHDRLLNYYYKCFEQCKRKKKKLLCKFNFLFIALSQPRGRGRRGAAQRHSGGTIEAVFNLCYLPTLCATRLISAQCEESLLGFMVTLECLYKSYLFNKLKCAQRYPDMRLCLSEYENLIPGTTLQLSLHPPFKCPQIFTFYFETDAKKRCLILARCESFECSQKSFYCSMLFQIFI